MKLDNICSRFTVIKITSASLINSRKCDRYAHFPHPFCDKNPLLKLNLIVYPFWGYSSLTNKHKPPCRFNTARRF